MQAHINTKPQDARKLISASMPKNISAADRKALIDDWNEKARIRAEHVARESATPTVASKIISVELRRFGNKWQAYIRRDKRWVAIMPDVSIGTSAIGAVTETIEDEVFDR